MSSNILCNNPQSFIHKIQATSYELQATSYELRDVSRTHPMIGDLTNHPIPSHSLPSLSSHRGWPHRGWRELLLQKGIKRATMGSHQSSLRYPSIYQISLPTGICALCNFSKEGYECPTCSQALSTFHASDTWSIEFSCYGVMGLEVPHAILACASLSTVDVL